MRFRTIRIDKVGDPVGELGPFLVIWVRGGRWCRWLGDSTFPGYDELAQNHIAVGLWDSQNNWFEVMPNDCPECGHPQPRCALCKDQAIYLLEWEEIGAHAYLCSTCGMPYVKINEVHEQFLEEIGWPAVEVGMYSCCDGCECDHWR